MWLFILAPLVLSATPEECLAQVSNFSLDSTCFKLLLSKFLGYSFLLMSIILKIPQIYKILANKSVQGISLTSFYLETFAFSICAAYGTHRGMPISTYGEHVVISFQCLVQNILFWTYGNVSFSHRIKATFVFAVWAVLIFGELLPIGFQVILPELLWTYCPFYIVAMNAFVKGSQIKVNYKNGSTGNLSFVTSFFNLYGTTTRIITTLIELSDPVWLFMYLVGFSLNLIVVGQFSYYWNVKLVKKD